MKFKTTIEIVTEAENHHDAADIAGEYLRGNLETGVVMRCMTRQMGGKRQFFVVISTLLFIGCAITASYLFIASHNQNMASRLDQMPLKETQAAVQPPLKTHMNPDQSADFKNDWDSKQKEITIKQIPPAVK